MSIAIITGLQKWKKSSRVKKESLQFKTSFYTVEYEGLHRRIYLAAITSLILETLPLRSAGSLFSTNNAAYLVIITSIFLCHKTLTKNNH